MEKYAILGGSVFRDSGFALPGAKVAVEAIPGPDGAARPKRIEAVTDARGEFAIRVPPTPMRYTVSVRANGFKPDRKEAAIQGEERVDVFFRLEPVSN